MTMMNYVELLEHVKAATGPSGDLDFDLLEMAGLGYYDYTRSHYAYRVDDPDRLDLTKAWGFDYPTRSIDHALALVERLLPDANCIGFEKDPKGWDAYLSRNNVPSGHWLIEQRGPTAPLAILASLLQALIVQESVPA